MGVKIMNNSDIYFEKSKKVLKYIFESVDGKLNNAIDKNNVYKDEFQQLNLEDWDEYEEIINYLKQEAFIEQDENNLLLRSKGINEVHKDFPTLDPKSS